MVEGAAFFFRIFLKEARFFPGFRALLEDASITVTKTPPRPSVPSRRRTGRAKSRGEMRAKNVARGFALVSLQIMIVNLP